MIISRKQVIGGLVPQRKSIKAMPKNELPAGIERLLTRVTYSCSELGHVHFRQDLLRKWAEEVADSHENGWELLRQGAVAQLSDEDAGMVDRALSILFVVGNAMDAGAVEPLLSHSNEQVRKAARTCLFEVRRRPSVFHPSSLPLPSHDEQRDGEDL